MTICTHQRQPIFGNISAGAMQLTRSGEIAAERWYALPEHHPGVDLDAFVVMPNHVHGIVVLSGGVADNGGVVPTLGTVIGSYKSGVTRCIRTALQDDALPVWQGRYHDHIIRSEADLNRIRLYVETNPACWTEDTFYSC